MKSKNDPMAPPRTAPKRKKGSKSFGKKSGDSRKKSDEHRSSLETHGTGEKYDKNMENGSGNSDEIGKKSGPSKICKTADKIVKNMDKVSKKSGNSTKKPNNANNKRCNPEDDINSDNDVDNIIDDSGKSKNVIEENNELENTKGKVKKNAGDGKKPSNNGNIKTVKDKNVENCKDINDKRSNKNIAEMANGGGKMTNGDRIGGKMAVKRRINTENGSNSKKAKYISEQKDQPNSNVKQTEKNNIVKNSQTKSLVSEKNIDSAIYKKVTNAKKDSNTNIKKVVEKKDGHSEHVNNETVDNNKMNEKSKLVKKVIKKNVASTGIKNTEQVNSVATSKKKLEVGNEKRNSASKIDAKKPNIDKNNEQNKAVTAKVVKKVVSNKTRIETDKTEKVTTKIVNNKNTQKAESIIDKNVSAKNLTKPQTISKVVSVNNTEKNVASTNKTTLSANIAKNYLQVSNKLKTSNTKFNTKLGNTEKENIQNKKISKIPQKNPALSALKNNPLRMSPSKYFFFQKLKSKFTGYQRNREVIFFYV